MHRARAFTATHTVQTVSVCTNSISPARPRAALHVGIAIQSAWPPSPTPVDASPVDKRCPLQTGRFLFGFQACKEQTTSHHKQQIFFDGTTRFINIFHDSLHRFSLDESELCTVRDTQHKKQDPTLEHSPCEGTEYVAFTNSEYSKC